MKHQGKDHRKQERVEFRANHKELEQFEKAASYQGVNLSAFLRGAALSRSAEILKSSTTLVLSDRDMKIFLDALENPPEPNAKLKKAITEYKKSHV